MNDDHQVVHRAIETIEVGDRVTGENPLGENDQSLGTSVSSKSWKKIVLRAENEEGHDSKITLLRPDSWIEENKIASNGKIYLEVPHCGISSIAEVVSIESCPEITPGTGNVVTGTFHHKSAKVIELFIEGFEKPIRTTRNHPFWSEDRQDFVRADELESGETLLSENGLVTVCEIRTVAGQHDVFNIDVFGSHVYRVSELGVLVHNSEPCPDDLVTEIGLRNGGKHTIKQGRKAPKKGPTHGHHSDPKFMGGDAKQPLTDVSVPGHKQLHKDLNDFLRNKTDNVGNHMRPQRGNSGARIRDNFTRQERLDAMAEFYKKFRDKYPDSARDFFKQHPGLE